VRGRLAALCFSHRCQVSAWADWTAWHLPGGQVGPPAWWAATSNVEVGQMTYPVNRGRVRRERREGNEGQSHKEEERERESGTGEEARDR